MGTETYFACSSVHFLTVSAKDIAISKSHQSLLNPQIILSIYNEHNWHEFICSVENNVLTEEKKIKLSHIYIN